MAKTRKEVTVPSRGTEVYIKHERNSKHRFGGFRPLLRYIGLYPANLFLMNIQMKKGFRPLARWIGLYLGKVTISAPTFSGFRPLSR